MPTSAKGLPWPAGSQVNNVPQDVQALAEAVDARLDPAYTSAQVAALAGADRWTGRVVLDATLGRLVVWDGAAWQPVPLAGDGAPGPLVNGGMEVWQRGTTGAFSTGPGAGRCWAADRWLVWRGFWATGASWYQTPLTRAVDAAGPRFALRMLRAAGDTGTWEVICGQGVRSGSSWPWAGRQVTVSAWLRAGPGHTGTVRLQVAAGTGADEDLAAGFTGQTLPVDAAVSVAAGGPFVRATATGTLPATATQIGVRVVWTPSGTAAAESWLDVTGVQVDDGPVARPWRQAPPAAEAAECARHYQLLGANDLWGSAHADTAVVLHAALAVPMRGTPAVTLPGSSTVRRIGYANLAGAAPTVDHATPTHVGLVVTAVTGLPQFAAASWAGADVALSAEL